MRRTFGLTLVAVALATVGCAGSPQPTGTSSNSSVSFSPTSGLASGTAPAATPGTTGTTRALTVMDGTITFNGMGKAQLGMTVAELARAFDAGMEYRPVTPCPWIRADVLGFEMHADRDGRATSFFVGEPTEQPGISPQAHSVFRPKTAEGIGLGSRRDEVLATYGTQVQPRRRVEPESTPTGLDPEDLVLASGPADEDYVISFDIRDGVVRSIAVSPFWMTYGEPWV